MNIVSNHNRLLRGAAIPTAGGDVYNSGWEYTPEGEISGYSGSAIYTGEECPCDSAAIVDSAFNKSTAWVDEQNYLTAHQDVTNLPYVQNSALGYNGNLISSISGDGFFAESANNSYHADDADHATYADSATHADSADFVATANFANSASSALNAEVANVAYTALTAQFLDGGWEHDDDGFITAYNNSAFAGAGGGGIEYEGIAPIVVDNEHHLISAESARLGVQNPLYFVEDSQTATVIGIYDSALSGRDWTDDITAASANALNEAINQITAVELANSALTAQTAINANHAASSDSATYDSLGRKIVDTYLTAHQQLPDWTPTIQNASGNAYNSAVNWVVDQHYLTAVTGDNTPYSAGDNIDITNHVVSGKDWSSEISDASANAVNEAINQITAVDYATSSNITNTALTANYVADGWEYNASNEITGYSGSAFHTETPSEGKIYTGISPIVVDNSTTTGTISAQTARLGVQSPLYFVEDTSASTVIGISGLPEVEGVMYESALNFGDGYITGYNSSALSSERSRYAVSSTSANGAISSQTAAIVTGGWETANGKITGYNGTAFSAGNTYDVKASSNISVATAGNTFTVSGKDWTSNIIEASSYACVSAIMHCNLATGVVFRQATADAAGKYIPYANISTGDSGTTVYNVASGIRVTAASGWVEMYNQNKENENEAHLQIGQNYSDGKSFWAELDGAGGGFLQMNWNSGVIGPNLHSSYSDGTCSALDISNGTIVYASATSALGDNYESHKVWQLGSEKLRFWNQWGTASFGPRGMEVFDSAYNCWYTKADDGRAHFIVSGSAGNGARGAVELAPRYINFYNDDWSLNQTLNVSDISALKALLNHVQSASASWANPSVATGSI